MVALDPATFCMPRQSRACRPLSRHEAVAVPKPQGLFPH